MIPTQNVSLYLMDEPTVNLIFVSLVTSVWSAKVDKTSSIIRIMDIHKWLSIIIYGYP